MNILVQYAALLCVVAGVLAAALTVVATGQGRLALRVALDFWLAAGLLRLGQVPGWEPLLVTAVIIAIRQLVGWALRRPPVRPRDLRAAVQAHDAADKPARRR